MKRKNISRSSTAVDSSSTDDEDSTMLDDDDDVGQSKRPKVVISSSPAGESSATKPFFCAICMDDKTEPEMFDNGCPHSYCRDCIASHVAAKIRDSLIAVKCPDPVCDALVEPQSCQGLIPRHVIERWEAALCEAALGSKKMYCPFRDCSAVLAVEDGECGGWGAASAECPYCRRLFCRKCRGEWHAGKRCKAKVDEADKKVIELAGKEKWQKCPNCKFYVQRTKGCSSIRCRCGHKFCYMCGSAWSFGHTCEGNWTELSFIDWVRLVLLIIRLCLLIARILHYFFGARLSETGE